MRPLGLRSISPHRLVGFERDVVGGSLLLDAAHTHSPAPSLHHHTYGVGCVVTLGSSGSAASRFRSSVSYVSMSAPRPGRALHLLPGILFEHLYKRMLPLCLVSLLVRSLFYLQLYVSGFVSFTPCLVGSTSNAFLSISSIRLTALPDAYLLALSPRSTSFSLDGTNPTAYQFFLLLGASFSALLRLSPVSARTPRLF